MYTYVIQNSLTLCTCCFFPNRLVWH